MNYTHILIHIHRVYNYIYQLYTYEDTYMKILYTIGIFTQQTHYATLSTHLTTYLQQCLMLLIYLIIVQIPVIDPTSTII